MDESHLELDRATALDAGDALAVGEGEGVDVELARAVVDEGRILKLLSRGIQ